MSVYRWDPAKNAHLRRTRGVSFEDVVLAIAQGHLLDVLGHPNPTKYSHQEIFVVEIRRYAYVVPFVSQRSELFLKTIIPSRKFTKQYLRKPREG